MNVLSKLWQSSVGKKFVMAVSGCVLFLFVIGHMLGNLQVFVGRESINTYAHFLQSNKEILWVVRLVLLAMLGLHVWSAVRLSLENKAARPVDYAHGQPPYAASYASRTMLMSGLIVASFIIYHLLHFTVLVQAVNLTGRDFAALTETVHGEARHDVFAMMILGFRHPLVALFYLVGVGLLCLHLSHGIEAMAQSLGVVWRWAPGLGPCLARTVALLLFLGYASIPVAILVFGYGKEVVK